MLINYIAGPLIGAVIGYCTNFIAVKMLFYPRKEVRVFGHKLPFTPGVIPKGKDRLALAIGDIVGNKLITQEDIQSKLLNDDLGRKIADEITSNAKATVKENLMDLTGLDEGSYQEKKEKISEAVTDAMIAAIPEMNLADFVIEKGGQTIGESLNNPMLAMFLTPELLQSILVPMSDKLIGMLGEEKDTLIRPVVENKLTEMEAASFSDLTASLSISDQEISDMISAVSMNLIRKCMGSVIDSLDIESIVREKVSAMSVEELEEIVLKVMKKELNTIVNLGALIGLIIGFLTILF